MHSIAALVEQSRNGDREAFAQIVKQFQGMVSAATLNVVGNYAQSEDLAQETFMTAWRKLPELREPEKLASWLYGIARRVALRWLEQQQRSPLQHASVIEADMMSDKKIQAEVAERQHREESLALIWATVKELPEMFREPLLLYYRYSKSVTDIAATLSLTEEAVRQRLSRGRKMLKAEVEKHVESVLEATGPNEYFVVGVLAALPVVLTGEQVLAAGAAGAAASQSASASGAGAGTSFAAGVLTFFSTLFSYILTPILVGLGITLGIWSGIRHAPTLAARQWMLKVSLGYFILGSLFFLLVLSATAGINYAVVNHRVVPERAFLRDLCIGIHLFLVGCTPVFVIAASYFVNRRWRKIVEADLENQNQSASNNSLQSIYLWGGIALVIFLFSVSTMIYLQQLPPWEFLCITTVVLVFAISLFYYAVQISKDREAFEKYPPRLPNLLAILTDEEKAPRGFRNRINFWGDLTGIGWGLFVIHVVFLGFYFHFRYVNVLEKIVLWSFPLGNGVSFTIYPITVILAPIVVLYLLFILLFAGIPRRRYWGMIFLGTSILLSDIIMCGWIFRSMLLPINSFVGAMYTFGLLAWYLLCFTFLGVSGLYVFRRRGSGIRVP